MPHKDSMYDDQQAAYDAKLAEIFGITPDELDSLEYEFNEDFSDDGMSHFGSYFSFSEDNPKEIMDKIVGLEDGNCVRFGPNGPDID